MAQEPTVELIETLKIVEGREFEFKQQVDFGDARQKSNFIDDVVAFLNGEIAGHIMIGIKEKGGAFVSYSPILGDPDQLCRRILSILQDGIAPKPLGIDVRTIAVSGGFVVNVAIPEHRMGPYQNLSTGAFYVRTGAKNTPLRRDELAGYFITQDRYDADLRARWVEEIAHLKARGVMDGSGAVLDLAILPREYYDRSRPVFDRGVHLLKVAPGFHFDRGRPLQGCERGYEAIEIDLYEKGICRVLISDDWFVQAQVAHPLSADGSGRVKIYEFKDQLTAFLASIDSLLKNEGLRGPFCVGMSVRNLQAARTIGWAFARSDNVSLPRLAWVEQVADADMINQFHRRLIGVSTYG